LAAAALCWFPRAGHGACRKGERAPALLLALCSGSLLCQQRSVCLWPLRQPEQQNSSWNLDSQCTPQPLQLSVCFILSASPRTPGVATQAIAAALGLPACSLLGFHPGLFAGLLLTRVSLPKGYHPGPRGGCRARLPCLPQGYHPGFLQGHCPRATARRQKLLKPFSAQCP
jgi:hypothetical protein